MHDEVRRQARIDERQATIATSAAAAARLLKAAQRRTIQAPKRYQERAQAAARLVGAAPDETRAVPRSSGGVAPPLTTGARREHREVATIPGHSYRSVR
jgi:hypothetical protein